MRRGVVYAVAIMLVASSLLYLVAVASIYSISLKETTSELATMELMNAYSDDTVYQLRSILISEGINVTVVTLPNGTTELSFRENLPLSRNYHVDLERFKEFAEGRSRFNTTINITEARIPRLYVQPQNITVEYQPGMVVFTPQNTENSAGRVTGYSMQILINDSTLSAVWKNISEVSPSDPNAMYFHLGMQGSNGTTSTSKYLSKYSYSELRLLDSQNKSVMVFQFNSPASVVLSYKNEFNLKTTIYLNSADENTSIELGNNIVSIGSEQTDRIAKVCGVIVHEG